MTIFLDQVHDGMRGLVTHEAGLFTCRVIYKEIEKVYNFGQNFEPRFGMDTFDQQIANFNLERMAVEIENEHEDFKK